MNATRTIASAFGEVARAMRARPRARRRSGWVAPPGLDRLEDRLVMTVTPIPPPAYQPPGLVQDYSWAGSPAVADSISGDTITYTLTGGAPGSTVTFSVYWDPGKPNVDPAGNHDNLAAQKLIFSAPVVLDGAGNATYTLDVLALLEAFPKGLTGQRHFQVDFWIGPAPTSFTPSHSNAASSLLFGALYDYTDTTGDKAKR